MYARIAKSQRSQISFELQEKLGSGTYGRVYSVKMDNGDFAAMKKMKEHVYEGGGLNPSTIREIGLLKALNHPNIVKIDRIEMSSEHIRIFMPLADGTLTEMIKNDSIHINDLFSLKVIMYQIVKGIAYCTSRNIVNRDIKPDNILFKLQTDSPPQMIISDFGLGKANVCMITGLSREVYSLWYRAPEILLGGEYDEKSEVWATACVLAEIFLKKCLFRGDSTIDQIIRMIKHLGCPNENSWPGVENLRHWQRSFSSITSRTFDINTLLGVRKLPNESNKQFGSDLFDLLQRALVMNPNNRCSIFDMQSHKFFDDVRDFVDKKSNYASPLACQTSYAERLAFMSTPYEIPSRDVKIENLSYISGRRVLFSWLSEVYREMNIKQLSLFLAMCLIDAYFSKTNKGGQSLKYEIQLIGCACMKIATDFYEVYPPASDEWVYLTDDSFSIKDLATAEIEVLRVLDYKIFRTTSVDYVRQIYKEYLMDEMCLAYSVLHTTAGLTLHYDYTPQEIAFACVLIAAIYNTVPFKSRKDQVSSSRVVECAVEIMINIGKLSENDWNSPYLHLLKKWKTQDIMEKVLQPLNDGDYIIT